MLRHGAGLWWIDGRWCEAMQLRAWTDPSIMSLRSGLRKPFNSMVSLRRPSLADVLHRELMEPHQGSIELLDHPLTLILSTRRLVGLRRVGVKRGVDHLGTPVQIPYLGENLSKSTKIYQCIHPYIKSLIYGYPCAKWVSKALTKEHRSSHEAARQTGPHGPVRHAAGHVRTRAGSDGVGAS